MLLRGIYFNNSKKASEVYFIPMVVIKEMNLNCTNFFQETGTLLWGQRAKV